MEKSTNKFEAKLDVKIEEFKEELLVSYPFLIRTEMELEDCLTTLRKYANDSGVTFVCGRGRRKIQLQRDIELLSNYATRKRKYLAEREQTGYIKLQNYKKSKKRKYKNNAYLRENMAYSETDDTYTFPNGNLDRLHLVRQKRRERW